MRTVLEFNGIGFPPYGLLPRYSQVMGRGNAVMHDDTPGVNFGASEPIDRPFPNNCTTNEKPVSRYYAPFAITLRLASLLIEHYDARHIIGVMIAALNTHRNMRPSIGRQPKIAC
jgi:hypothetical protein